MGAFPETDTTDAEEAVIASGSAAQTAAIVAAHLEFGRALLLDDETLFRHSFSRRSRAGMQHGRT